jgi:hypothetical protein
MSEKEEESVFTFSKPQYAKTAGGAYACVFNCYYNGLAEPSISSDAGDTPTIDEILMTDDSRSFVNDLCEAFVKSCSKYFPGKKLSVAIVKSKLKHVIQTTRTNDTNSNFEGFLIWQVSPLAMVVSGTEIHVHWEQTKVHMEISLGDDKEEAVEATKPVEEPLVQLTLNEAVSENRQVAIEEEVAAVSASSDELIVVDDIPLAQDQVVHVMSPAGPTSSTAAAREKAGKKLREARLQVQLAKFRAARAYEKYVAKYGDDLSDTDTDATTDYTSGEESSD